MKLTRRQFLQLAAGATAVPAASRIARAQAYPSRPVTMIVPFPAGGATTTLARVLAGHRKTTLAQPIVGGMSAAPAGAHGRRAEGRLGNGWVWEIGGGISGAGR